MLISCTGGRGNPVVRPLPAKRLQIEMSLQVLFYQWLVFIAAVVANIVSRQAGAKAHPGFGILLCQCVPSLALTSVIYD